VKNGLDARLIHADERYGARGQDRLYTDLVIGNRLDTKLFVELIWIRITHDGSISRRRMTRIMSDIAKSKQKESRRRRYLLVFLHRGGRPLAEGDLTLCQRRHIELQRRKLTTEGVKVLFSI
jgi:hypothetical protein